MNIAELINTGSELKVQIRLTAEESPDIFAVFKLVRDGSIRAELTEGKLAINYTARPTRLGRVEYDSLFNWRKRFCSINGSYRIIHTLELATDGHLISGRFNHIEAFRKSHAFRILLTDVTVTER